MKKWIKVLTFIFVLIFSFTFISCTQPKPSDEEPPVEPVNKEFECLYDVTKQGYVLLGLSNDYKEENVIVPNTYDDGVNGNKNIVAVKSGVFKNLNKIKSVQFPTSLTEVIADKSSENNGFLFSGCESLEYVKADGILQFIGECNFYNCVNLKKVVLNKGAILNASNFCCSSTMSDYSRQVDIFINGDTLGSSFVLPDNNYRVNYLLSGKFYFYNEDGKCSTWKYDENNVPQISREHDYFNGYCIECDAMDPEGVNYYYNYDISAYVIKDILADYNQKVVKIPTYFDDGVHGQKYVEGINAGAFTDRKMIEQCMLPRSVKYIIGASGGIFSGCANLKIVSLGGLKSLYSIDNVKTVNNFKNCIQLEKIVVSTFFTLHQDYQQFFVETNESKFPNYVPKLDVYVDGQANNLDKNFGIGSAPEYGYNNNMFTDNIYFYSETLASGTWRYVNGVPTLWE